MRHILALLLCLLVTPALAQTPQGIPSLSAASAASGADLFATSQGGSAASKKQTLSAMGTALAGANANAGNPLYNSGSGLAGTPTIINALAMSGADACAQISNAAQALPAYGGIIDDRGSNGVQSDCAGSMFDSWPSCQTNQCSITLLLGPALYLQDFKYAVPPHTTVIGQGNTGSAGPKTYLDIGPNFMVALPSAPTVTTTTSGGDGSLVNGSTYYTFVTYANSHDESIACSTPTGAYAATCGQSSGNLIGNSTSLLTVTAPCSSGSPPTGVTGYNVYATSTSGWTHATLQNSSPVACGTNFVFGTAAQTYTTTGHTLPLAMPVVQMGPINYSGSPYYGVDIERVAADCYSNNGGTRETTLTGFVNTVVQQGGTLQHVNAWTCEIGYDIDAASQNSGPYVDLVQGDSSNLDAASNCMRIATNGGQLNLAGTIQRISCGSNSSTPQTYSIMLDAANVTLDGLDMEQAVNAVYIGSQHTAAGSTVRNVSCGSGITTSCVDIAFAANVGGVTLSEINANSGPTDTIIDPGTGTNCGTITRATTPVVSLYIHGSTGANSGSCLVQQ
jgi:hypothetical protein